MENNIIIIFIIPIYLQVEAESEQVSNVKITWQDLEDNVARHGPLSADGFLLFNYGWSQYYWTDQAKYFDNQPCLEDSAVEWIHTHGATQLGVGVGAIAPECADNSVV